MRQIVKIPFAPYDDFLRQRKPNNYEELEEQIRTDVRLHILDNEQFGISAYTERVLNRDSKAIHIDHFIKQQFLQPGTRTLEYNNFFVDEHAGAKNYGADYKDCRELSPIDTLEKNSLLINPAKEDPHRFFLYTTEGEIYSNPDLPQKDYVRAELTIKAFNLNHNSLVQERSAVFNNIKSCKQGCMSAEDVKSWLLSQPYQYSYPSFIEFICDNAFDFIEP